MGDTVRVRGAFDLKFGNATSAPAAASFLLQTGALARVINKFSGIKNGTMMNVDIEDRGRRDRRLAASSNEGTEATYEVTFDILAELSKEGLATAHEVLVIVDENMAEASESGALNTAFAEECEDCGATVTALGAIGLARYFPTLTPTPVPTQVPTSSPFAEPTISPVPTPPPSTVHTPVPSPVGSSAPENGSMNAAALGVGVLFVVVILTCAAWRTRQQNKKARDVDDYTSLEGIPTSEEGVALVWQRLQKYTKENGTIPAEFYQALNDAEVETSNSSLGPIVSSFSSPSSPQKSHVSFDIDLFDVGLAPLRLKSMTEGVVEVLVKQTTRRGKRMTLAEIHAVFSEPNFSSDGRLSNFALLIRSRCLPDDPYDDMTSPSPRRLRNLSSGMEPPSRSRSRSSSIDFSTAPFKTPPVRTPVRPPSRTPNRASGRKAPLHSPSSRTPSFAPSPFSSIDLSAALQDPSREASVPNAKPGFGMDSAVALALVSDPKPGPEQDVEDPSVVDEVDMSGILSRESAGRAASKALEAESDDDDDDDDDEEAPGSSLDGPGAPEPELELRGPLFHIRKAARVAGEKTTEVTMAAVDRTTEATQAILGGGSEGCQSSESEKPSSLRRSGFV